MIQVFRFSFWRHFYFSQFVADNHGVPQLGDRGKAAVGEADGGDGLGPVGDLDQLGGLGAGASERLLAQDVASPTT